MSRQLNVNKIAKGTWFKFEENDDFEIRIRPLTTPHFINRPPAEKQTKEITAIKQDEKLREWFMFSVVDWKNYKGEDGNLLECNKENKEMVSLYDSEVLTFVTSKHLENRANIVASKESKN